MKKFNENILEAMMFPKIIRVKQNLFLACFDLMKILPAYYILNKAEDENKIGKDSIIIETSSGTFGLALALWSNLKGYKLILISDPCIDKALERRLTDLGAIVEIVNVPKENGNVQIERLEKMHHIMGKYDNYFHPNQYDNPENPESYSLLSSYLINTLGSIDILVGPVGSGGSMCGTTRYLRRAYKKLHAVGVDTFNSVLFGMNDGKRTLRGLGNSLMISNVDHTVFDDVHWIDAPLAFYSTRVLQKKYSIFQGGTSGASYRVAEWYAAQNLDAKVVCICPDSGHRYINTIYNDTWLKQNNLFKEDFPDKPLLVDHPIKATSPWSFIEWEKKTYSEIVGQPYL